MPPRRTRRPRRLVKLEDVGTCIGSRVDIIAVVNDVGLPKITQGTDLVCTIRVIDETKYQTGTTINLFLQSAQAFPCFEAAGDIIQLCNVKLESYHTEVNATFYKDSSSFALFKGRYGLHYDPYQQYSPDDSRVTNREVDRNCIDDLRDWLANFQIPQVSGDFPMLREIKEGHLNLACKILHCWKVANQWFVYVWDGTDTPPNVMNAMPNDEINSPLPLELEPPLPRDILHTFPTVGSILRINFEQFVETNHLPILNIDKWVKFVNLSLKVDSASRLWHGNFNPQSKIRYTPHDDCLITERQRLSDDRISLTSRKFFIDMIPQSISSLSEVFRITRVEDDHKNRRHSTLMRVLNHSKETKIFKCVVRVVAVEPSQVENFYCPIEKKYRMRLTLEDPTSRIYAFVFDKDGETLFDGYPSIANLKKKLNRLLGMVECEGNDVSDFPRNPPWVNVCIKSYYKSKTNQRGSRIFALYDTKIFGDP
ncbi:hypothetical protein P8452_40373 [Trifolium repens]|nr:hypothetical protein P8452_40373 [Trifolium repens]